MEARLPQRLYLGIAAAAGAVLALEIGLTRLFSYTIWYHFAYLTISVALLGFGSSGALVSAFPSLFERRGVRLLVAGLVAAAASVLAGVTFLARFPIEVQNLTSHANAEEIIYSADYMTKSYLTSLPVLALVGVRLEP